MSWQSDFISPQIVTNNRLQSSSNAINDSSSVDSPAHKNNNNNNLENMSLPPSGNVAYLNNINNNAMLYTAPSFSQSPAFPLSSSKQFISQIVDLIRLLKIKLIAFDFDCTIVTIHTGGQWLDSPEKLAEFVRPCFRDLLPALLHCADLFVCVVTYSPQEQLIREVLRISMKDEHSVNDLINKIVIKGNTKEFMQEHGIDSCFSNGKQLHLKYCRNVFENIYSPNYAAYSNVPNSANKQKGNLFNDANVLLIDDDIQNVKFAFDNGHFAYHVNNTMKLVDFYNFLKHTYETLM